jgi:hypothetical protein
MFSSNPCRFVLFLLLSLSANAETVRGAQRELDATPSVLIGTATNYQILAKSGISSVPQSSVTGDIGVSPIAATAITGFSLIADKDGQFSTSTQVAGNVYAADYGGPTAVALTTAVSNMETAYTDAKGRPNADDERINLGDGVLGVGGLNGGVDAKLTAGVYTFGSSVTINATIYFSGSDSDIFILQIAGDMLQVAGTEVILDDGALAENIFWQVAGEVDVKLGAHMEGVLLVKTAVTFEAGSSLSGRVLTQTACNLDQATIN